MEMENGFDLQRSFLRHKTKQRTIKHIAVIRDMMSLQYLSILWSDVLSPEKIYCDDNSQC